VNGSSQLVKSSLRSDFACAARALGILQVCGVLSERCGWRRVRLESVADWLAASDPGPQLTSSDYPGPALTFDLPLFAGAKKPRRGVGAGCGLA
jgi:hypothetical protein